MIDLIIALLFGKTLLLTNQPVDILSTYEMTLEHPISAVTDGPTIRIEVPVETFSRESRVDKIHQAAQAAFPDGSISARLSQLDGGKSVSFAYKGWTGQSGSHMWLYLEPTEQIPTREDFSKLSLASSVTPLRHVKIYWRNCKQVGG
jgi:hypothetical protein